MFLGCEHLCPAKGGRACHEIIWRVYHLQAGVEGEAWVCSGAA